MSQPHPPRPEDQSAQQSSQSQEPRTQQIPVITPDAQPETPPAAQPEPRPAFLSQPEPTPAAPPPGPFTTAVLPAVDASGAPQQAAGPPAPAPAPAQQAVQPERAWPQPGPAGAHQGPAGAPQSTGPLDVVPGFSPPAPPPVPPQGSTAVTAPEAPAAPGVPFPGVHAPGGEAAGADAPGAGTRARAAGKALGARLGGLRPAPAPGRRPARAVLAGLGLGVLALVVLELALTLDPGDRSLWSAVPSWSAFATVAAVVALVPLALALAPGRLPAGSAWRIGAAGVAGLAAFWVLIVLPLVASDRGFLLTAALALAAGALWLAPGRPE